MTSTATTDAPARRPATATSGGMARLVLVELRRYAARAGVRWLLVGMVAAVALTAFGAYRSSRAPSEEAVALAHQQYQAAQADWQQNGQAAVEQCREQQATARQTDPTVDFGCDQMPAPTLESYLPQPTTFAVGAPGWVDAVATFTLLLALIVGATFVAAEFSTGAMTTWLTFEPRRGRVFASKVLVATVATALAALVVVALAIAATWAATAVNGAAGGTTSRTWVDLGDQAGRIVAAAAGAALLGAGLAFLLRHTAGCLAVAIGWLVAVDGLVVQALLKAPRWTAQLNLQAWLAGGTSQSVGATSCSSDSAGVTTCNGTEIVVTMTQAGLTLLVLLAVVTAFALVVFRRRDVA